MKKPKDPAPTTEELAMRKRQTEELARLDDEENRRLKGLTRMRLGSRSLLAGATRGQGGGAPAASAPAAARTPSLGGGGFGGGAGGGSRGVAKV